MAIRTASLATGAIVPVGGPAGLPGQSAYQAWLALGNAGSLADFMAAQKGQDGLTQDISGKLDKAGLLQANRTYPQPPAIALTIFDWIADLQRAGSLLRSLGFVGNGASHPLSGAFASLAAAQAVFPRAQALTEEIDGHAIQRLIDLGNTAIRLPDGCAARTSFPLRSGATKLFLKGCDSAIVQVTAGADGWHHGTADTGGRTVYDASLRVEGVRMQCIGVGGTAWVVEQDPTSGTWLMDDVLISGFGNQTQNYWTALARGTGCSTTRWTKCQGIGCNGGNLATAQDGIVITHDAARFSSAGTYVFAFTDCDVNFYRWAYRFDITRPLEGLWIDGGNVNQCMGVLQSNNTYYPTNSYRAPQYFVTRLQAECYSTYFDLGGVKYGRITGNLFIVSGPVSGVASPADYSWDLFAVRGGSYDIEICGNAIELQPGCRPRYVLNVDGAAGQTTLARNRFTVDAGAAATALVNFGASGNGLFEVREFDNRGLSGVAWSVSAGTADRMSKNFSEASILQKLSAAGQGDRLIALNRATGDAHVRGSRAVAPSSGQIVAALPSGVLAGAPAEMTAAFGDTTFVLSGEMPIPSLTSATATSLPIAILNYTGSNPRRVNFSVTG